MRFSRVLLTVVTLMLLGVLAAPLVLVLLYSFTDDPSFTFPPGELTAHAYTQFTTGSGWVDAIGDTFVSATAVGAIATCTAALAVLAVDRSRVLGAVATVIASVPLFLSPVIVCVAYYLLLEQLPPLVPGARVVLAQVTMALPFVFLVCREALREDASPLPMAARSLGAGEWQVAALRLRLARGPLSAAFALGFIVSAGDPVAPIFLGSVPYETLAQKAGEGIRYGIDPRANIAALIIVGVVIVGSVAVGQFSGRTPSTRQSVRARNEAH